MRLRWYYEHLGIDYVSIHAPVKGATVMFDSGRQKELVSIHAPVKGATVLLILHMSKLKRFNSRTRKGCDYRLAAKKDSGNYVSIHAPVKGATV